MALGLPLGNTHRGVSRRTSSPELGGRNVELSMLQAALDGVGAGRGRLVGVERDAGVGKTRLVEYFTGHAMGARAERRRSPPENLPALRVHLGYPLRWHKRLPSTNLLGWSRGRG
jgi:hypothetical protein